MQQEDDEEVISSTDLGSIFEDQVTRATDELEFEGLSEELERLALEYDLLEEWITEHQTPTYNKDSRLELECLWQCYTCKNMYTNYLAVITYPQHCKCGSVRVKLLRYEKVAY